MELLGRFTSSIAHDFNTLLTVVLAASDAITDRGGVDSDTLEDVAQVRAAALRGAALVRHLLAFARDTPSVPRLVELREAAADLAPMLRHVLGRPVRLDLDLGSDDLPVWIDPTRFDQVVVNLAANAREAMPDGGVLTLRCRAEPGGEACVELHDTGTGIAPEVLPRIFDPFFTTRGERGTGLGLATVQDIIRQAGGHVRVESVPGAGTCMRIFLPLAGCLPATPPARAPSGGGTVLLVEDETVARQLATRALASSGWRVLAAGSAEAALAAAAGRHLSVVVTDMELPGRSGASLVAALRGWPGQENLPALIVSGHAEAGLRRDPAVRALLDVAWPTTALLSKPYGMAELRARVAGAVATLAPISTLA